MQPTIQLFTWENEYALHQEILKRYTGFRAKHQDGGFYYYTPLNWDQDEIEQVIYWWWLFASFNLIILNGAPLDTTPWNVLKVDQFEHLATMILERGVPQGSIVVFVSYKPDKRTRFFKAFPKENIKTFDVLESIALKNFIQKKAHDYGLSFGNTEIEILLKFVGINQFRLEWELEKLAFYSRQNPNIKFTEEIVQNIVYSTPEMNNFDFFDYLISDQKKAYQYLLHMQEEWSNFMLSLGFFYWGIKNYILLIDAYSKGIKDAKLLASALKMHPFVLKKNLGKIKTLLEKKSYIHHFFKELVRLESDIKSGITKEQDFRIRIKQIFFSH